MTELGGEGGTAPEVGARAIYTVMTQTLVWRREVMGALNCKTLAATFFLVITMVVASTAIGETEFKKVKLLTEISLDVPAQWKLKVHEKSRSFTVEEVAKEKRTLLLAHSLSANAMISVSLWPKKNGLNTKELESMTAERLSKIKGGLAKGLSNSGELKVITIHDPVVMLVSGLPALVTGYLRAGADDPEDTWDVINILIPRPDLDVRISLSWSSKRDDYWSPVMIHVVKSFVTY